MKQTCRKRVLLLLENRPFPQDVRVFQEAQALFEAGYQVSVISPAEPKQALREDIDGIHVFRYLGVPEMTSFIGYLWEYGYSLLAMFALSLLVWIRPGFDVIHAANPPDTGVFIALFYRLFGKRFIFDHHDLAPELYIVRFEGKAHKFIYSILLWLEKLSCKVADHIIATNRTYKELEIRRGHVPEPSITIVRNGPDLSLFKPICPDPYLKEKNGVCIGYAGTMGHQDGVEYLLRAIQCLIDQGRTDFFCIMVGSGDAVPRLKSMVDDMGLAKYFMFLGWVEHSEVPRYLSAVDICVAPEPSNPYNDSSTMIKLMEYMALGKPVVAFDLPEHRTTAQNAARYARPNDVQDLACQIQILMDDPDLREALGKEGRKRIVKDLAWNHQKQRLIEAYSNLLG